MAEPNAAPRVAAYTRMDEGTVEDYALQGELAEPFVARTGERVVAYLQGLAGGLPGFKVDRYEHSLQTATRALRAGECEEFIVAALVHDVGDVLAPENHSELGASILRPYVARHTYWMVLQHGLFQGYYYFDKIGLDRDARERHRGHPAFEMTERFCRDYDQVSFDPDYDTLPIEHFRPMVERIFSRKPWGEHAERDLPLADQG